MKDYSNYYIAPSDERFEEIRNACNQIWLTYDNTHGYRTEKIERIKDLPNVKDNAIFMVKMFDPFNQRKLLVSVSKPTALWINERL